VQWNKTNIYLIFYSWCGFMCNKIKLNIYRKSFEGSCRTIAARTYFILFYFIAHETINTSSKQSLWHELMVIYCNICLWGSKTLRLNASSTLTGPVGDDSAAGSDVDDVMVLFLFFLSGLFENTELATSPRPPASYIQHWNVQNVTIKTTSYLCSLPSY